MTGDREAEAGERAEGERLVADPSEDTEPTEAAEPSDGTEPSDAAESTEAAAPPDPAPLVIRRRGRRVTTEPSPGWIGEPEQERAQSRENDERLRGDVPPHWG